MIAQRESNLRLVTANPRGCELSVTISPRAAFNSLELGSDGTLRARIAAVPVDGAANAALLKFLAKTLRVPKSQLAIAAGHTSRHKRIVVTGFAPAELESRLHEAIPTPADIGAAEGAPSALKRETRDSATAISVRRKDVD